MRIDHGLGFLLAVGLLCPSGCIIISDDDGGSDTANDTGATTSTTSTTGSQGEGSTAATSDGTASDETASDETAAGGACGWGPTGEEALPEAYVCGGDGEDPNGNHALLCPETATLEEGAPCGEITGFGCCDAAGNAWYCGDDGSGQALAVFECSG